MSEDYKSWPPEALALDLMAIAQLSTTRKHAMLMFEAADRLFALGREQRAAEQQRTTSLNAAVIGIIDSVIDFRQHEEDNPQVVPHNWMVPAALKDDFFCTRCRIRRLEAMYVSSSGCTHSPKTDTWIPHFDTDEERQQKAL